MVHLNTGTSVNWAKPQIRRRTGLLSDESTARNGLVSIILAIKSSRGESIVFYYPPETDQDAMRSQNTRNEETDSESDADDEFVMLDQKNDHFESRAGGQLPTIQERDVNQEEVQEAWTPGWKRVLKMDSALLADILTPQKSDNKFEMWIDNLVFLGSPAHLHSDGFWLQHGSSSGSHQVSGLHDIGGSAVHARPAISTSERRDSAPTIGSPMTTFHLVFALDTKADAFYNTRITSMYNEIVRQLTMVLCHEQAECEYVWNQCEAIMAIQRHGETNQSSTSMVWQDIVNQCDLAKVIKETYCALSRDVAAHVLINNQRSLSLLIPRRMTSDVIPRDTSIEHPILSSASSFGLSVGAADSLILPHYALILLGNVEHLLKKLPSRASPLLARMLRKVDPRKNFYALAEALDVPVQLAISVASDLLRWRCALPIPPLHEKNIYITSPTANKTLISQASEDFAELFPNGPALPTLLASMSQNVIPYGKTIPHGQPEMYMNILAWLMRSGWIIQVRTFAWVKIRAEIKIAVHKEQHEEDEETLDESTWGDSIIADPYNASVQEQQWLHKLASHRPVAEATLFHRVCKYFNGLHAIEKITVREGIDPRSMRRVLDAFEEDLVQSYTW